MGRAYGIEGPRRRRPFGVESRTHVCPEDLSDRSEGHVTRTSQANRSEHRRAASVGLEIDMPSLWRGLGELRLEPVDFIADRVGDLASKLDE